MIAILLLSCCLYLFFLPFPLCDLHLKVAFDIWFLFFKQKETFFILFSSLFFFGRDEIEWRYTFIGKSILTIPRTEFRGHKVNVVLILCYFFCSYTRGRCSLLEDAHAAMIYLCFHHGEPAERIIIFEKPNEILEQFGLNSRRHTGMSFKNEYVVF